MLILTIDKPIEYKWKPFFLFRTISLEKFLSEKLIFITINPTKIVLSNSEQSFERDKIL